MNESVLYEIDPEILRRADALLEHLIDQPSPYVIATVAAVITGGLGIAAAWITAKFAANREDRRLQKEEESRNREIRIDVMDRIVETLLNTRGEIDRIRKDVNDLLHEMGTNAEFKFSDAKEYLDPLISLLSKHNLTRVDFLIRAAFPGQLAHIDSVIAQYDFFVGAVGKAGYQMMHFSNISEANSASEAIRSNVKHAHELVSKQLTILLNSLSAEYRSLV